MIRATTLKRHVYFHLRKVRETLWNEWTPSAVCESRADWFKLEELSNRDQQIRGSERSGEQSRPCSI